ncbi:MAG: antibiotic biosynthesis monooxygenase [Sporichthyaceae bacterium]|nr:antibiotic biosynthesis monooxygenase [Sporichthyaceae bacterium]
MLVVSRYHQPAAQAQEFLATAKVALAALAARPGYRGGRIGRSTDDPRLWVISTEWVDVGSYRRALGDFQVKIDAVPLLSQAYDEPTAFEIFYADGGAEPLPPAESSSSLAADAGTVGLGQAAAPHVDTDL